MRALVHNYGSKYREVMKFAGEHSDQNASIGDSQVLKAEVVHAVREEMAQKLADVVFRRTDLGSACYPGDPAVHMCADIMAIELSWDPARKEKEIMEVKQVLPQFC
jgi:glycerol-3-phosphate dehydrogenase